MQMYVLALATDHGGTLARHGLVNPETAGVVTGKPARAPGE